MRVTSPGCRLPMRGIPHSRTAAGNGISGSCPSPPRHVSAFQGPLWRCCHGNPFDPWAFRARQAQISFPNLQHCTPKCVTSAIPHSTGTILVVADLIIIVVGFVRFTMPPVSSVPRANGPGASSGQASRTRAPQACLSCRSRKVRCDVSTRRQPCTNCDLDGKDCLLVGRGSRLYEEPPTASP